jgi:lauroyl/myristoyl acyltransferase
MTVLIWIAVAAWILFLRTPERRILDLGERYGRWQARHADAEIDRLERAFALPDAEVWH